MKNKLIKIIILIIIFFQILQVNAINGLNPKVEAFIDNFVQKNISNVQYLQKLLSVINSNINKYNPSQQIALQYFRKVINNSLTLSNGGFASNGGNTNGGVNNGETNSDGGGTNGGTANNGGNPNNGTPSTGTIKIAIMGDGVGDSSDVRHVLKDIKKFGAELVIHNGDFHSNGGVRESMISGELGSNIAFVGTIGNHDISPWGSFDKMLKTRVNNNSNLTCNGTLGKKSICHYKGIAIVTAAPGFSGGGDGSYINDVLKNSHATWRFCHWHYNQTPMQVGSKGNSAGWSVYEESRKAGCITMNGHDHSYARTYLLDNMKTQHVINNSKNGPYLIKPGQTIHLLVGSSGKSLYSKGSSYNLPHWAVKYASSDGSKGNGVLLCTINGRKMHCDFKSISGQITDSFDLTSGN